MFKRANIVVEFESLHSYKRHDFESRIGTIAIKLARSLCKQLNTKEREEEWSQKFVQQIMLQFDSGSFVVKSRKKWCQFWKNELLLLRFDAIASDNPYQEPLVLATKLWC